METTGKVYGETSSKFNSDLLDEYANGEGKLIDFLLPMGVLIGMTIISGDLFISVIAALFVCLVLYVPRKNDI